MSDAVAIDLPLVPESARQAREKLEPFRKSLDEISFSDLRLLVSELVVEALNAESKSDDARIELRAEFRDDRIQVEVADGREAFTLPPCHPEPGELGWGLYLVARLSNSWDVRRESGRSVVWIELLAPPRG
jgi:anti-sigma regulatory factor (Ser/Thr protein kinase)